MKDNNFVIDSKVLEWLLQDENPSVKFFTLTELLDRPANDSEVLETKYKIMKYDVIKKILCKQSPDGYWFKPEDFYIRTKYKGTVWNLIILAELGADPNDIRIKRACEFIINNSQDLDSGGFAYIGSKDRGGDHNKILPCLSGNMIWCLIRLGFFGDSRVNKGIDWITKYQRFDDGKNKPPNKWPYIKFENCWGKHTCTMCIVKTLKALAEIPQNQRTLDVKNTIQQAKEFLLIHHLYKKSHNLEKIAKNDWTKFGFPLLWQTDVLEMLLILTGLDIKDERMNDGINLVLSKQNEDKKWILEKTFNGRTITNIETKGKPSKWITLNSLRVLKRYYS